MIFSYQNQPFHLVEESPWPIFLSMQLFNLLVSLVNFFWFSSFFFCFNFFFLLLILYVWSHNIIRESTYLGFHTKEVELGLKWSMGWFIVSEVFFFLAFFWGFFHSSLSTSWENGDMWPPLFITPMLPFTIPLLNTMILLSSGVSLTWAHHALIAGNFKNSIYGLMITVNLGLYFTVLQIFEYGESIFCFYDTFYGSIFFLSTGFHGLHVLIGSTLLSICFFRILKNQYASNHHIGLETAGWYWHFVDIVWLFLFCSIYWWGNW